jgi:hypothetical protein
VLHPVSMPDSNDKVVDVFRFGVNSMCGRMPLSKEEIAVNALGSKVKVVGKPFPEKDQSTSGPIKLNVGTGRWFLIFMGTDSNVNDLAASMYDYKSVENVPSWGTYFELRKDLARLRQAGTEIESQAVLRRLASYDWRQAGVRVNAYEFFRPLLRQSLGDERSIQEIEQIHIDAMKARGMPPAWEVKRR